MLDNVRYVTKLLDRRRYRLPVIDRHTGWLRVIARTSLTNSRRNEVSADFVNQSRSDFVDCLKFSSSDSSAQRPVSAALRRVGSGVVYEPVRIEIPIRVAMQGHRRARVATSLRACARPPGHSIVVQHG